MPPPAPKPPVPAASLILLRDRGGLEVLIGRRSERTPAFPGATVFPGGKLDRQDRDWPGAGDLLTAAAHAALRETFEETGLFVAADGGGPPEGAEVARARLDVEAGARSFAEVSRSWGKAVGIGRLAPFAHWVTPEASPYRFDTLFFIVEASPAEAGGELIRAEFDTLDWRRPADLLSSGEVRLMPPTRRSLEVVCEAHLAREAVEAARRRGLIVRPGVQPLDAR